MLTMRWRWAFIALTLAGCIDRAPLPETNDRTERTVPVITARPVIRTVDYVTEALGTIESRAEPTVSAEASGRVCAVHAEEGDRVREGELLLEIDDRIVKIEIAKAEAELQRQQAMLTQRRQQLQRLQKLAHSRAVAQDRLDDAQAEFDATRAQRDVARQQLNLARERLENTRVKAPTSAIIARRHVSPGDYATVGGALFDLVAVDRLRARFAFPEHVAAEVAPGAEVRLTSPTHSQSSLTATVKNINPKVASGNRALQVIVEFDNPGGWKPGGSVNGRLIRKRVKAAVTVPARSVVKRTDGDVVYLLGGDNRAKQRGVVTGWREDGWVHVIEGLNRDERIVVEGAHYLANGTPVTTDEVAR